MPKTKTPRERGVLFKTAKIPGSGSPRDFVVDDTRLELAAACRVAADGFAACSAAVTGGSMRS